MIPSTTKLTLDNWFTQHFDITPSQLAIWTHLENHSIEAQALLLGSFAALRAPYLVQRDILGLMDERKAFENYQLFGFWGYGINSYSVVYAWLHKNIRVYLRLPYGGVYHDNKAGKKAIPHIISAAEALISHSVKENASLSFYSFSGQTTLKYYGHDFLELELANLYKQTDELTLAVNSLDY